MVISPPSAGSAPGLYCTGSPSVNPCAANVVILFNTVSTPPPLPVDVALNVAASVVVAVNVETTLELCSTKSGAPLVAINVWPPIKFTYTRFSTELTVIWNPDPAPPR